MRKVTVIKPIKGKERVCAYVRVSTSKDDQINSFLAQSEYWEDKLSQNPSYQYMGIFADEGISGYSMKNRVELNEMLDLARSNQIDRIFVKSVSRLARNWSETIEIIRELRELNIPVYFENENIDSNDPKCNLMLNVYASLAEEELRSMSNNQKWSVRKRFENGSVELGRIYGYDYIDKQLVINKKESEVVKYIFQLYLNGYGYTKIAQLLEERRYKTKYGKKKWNPSTIGFMLKNEKYIGDGLLQKHFNVNMEQRKNNGELPQFYVKDSHQAIISREDFAKVQEITATRAKKYNTPKGVKNTKYPLSGKIVCEKCGARYGRKINGKGKSYECVKWMCNTKNEKTVKACSNTDIKDDVVTELLLKAYNEFVENKVDSLELTEEKEKLSKLLGNERELKSLYARGYIKKEHYIQTEQVLLNKIKKAEKQVENLSKIAINFKRLTKTDKLTADAIAVIDKIVVNNWKVKFKFINGYTITNKYTNGRAGNVNGKLKKTKHSGNTSKT